MSIPNLSQRSLATCSSALHELWIPRFMQVRLASRGICCESSNDKPMNEMKLSLVGPMLLQKLPKP